MRYLLVFLLFLPACQYAPDTGNAFHDKAGDSASWRRFYYDGFALRTPGDWVRYSLQGRDSYASGLTNGTDSLIFDFGDYAPRVGVNGGANRLFAAAKIDGFPAVFSIPVKPGQNDCELEIYLSDRDRFYLGGRVRDTHVALAIFQSVTFDDGHPQQTDSLLQARFSADIPKTSDNARALFDQYCAQCHSRYKLIIGPALSAEFLRGRSDQWIYQYVTHRKKLTHDSLWLATSKEFNNVPCMEYPDLSRTDIDLMLSWLRTPETRRVESIP